MAGHSKWTNTKHRKASQDAKRAKIFTKIIRELVTAVRLGSSDPSSNPRLRAAIDKALSNNMTRDTLNRAIARGIGVDEDTKMETIIYEGYGPGGVAIMVECLSENRNRTVSEVRYTFNKFGGNLVKNGSITYLFNKNGVLSFEKKKANTIGEILESSSKNVVINNNGIIKVYTTLEELNSIYDILESGGLKADSVEITMIPSIKVDLDMETTLKLRQLIISLENLADVQKVYHNGEMFNETTMEL